MIYNKNCGPVAIKTERTMRLSRGFLAFIFIFGLSVALTAEAGKKGRNSSTTTSRKRVIKQALGNVPIRQHQSIGKAQWDRIVKWAGLNPSHKAFTHAFQTLEIYHKKNLEGFLKDIRNVITEVKFEFEENGRELLFGEVIRSVLMSVKDNNGSGDRVLLLNVVMSMNRELSSWSPGLREHKMRSVFGFLKVLHATVQILPKDASLAEIKEEARQRYNLSVVNGELRMGEFLLEDWSFDMFRKEEGKSYRISYSS